MMSTGDDGRFRIDFLMQTERGGTCIGMAYNRRRRRLRIAAAESQEDAENRKGLEKTGKRQRAALLSAYLNEGYSDGGYSDGDDARSPAVFASPAITALIFAASCFAVNGFAISE